MKVNFNDSSYEFAALQQLLARRALEAQMSGGQVEQEGDKTPAKTAAGGMDVFQLIAAENLLAAVSEVPDLESAGRLAEMTREDIVAEPSRLVRGQANIAPSDVLKLLK